MNEQPLTDHLSELRRRISWVLGVFLVSMLGSFYFSIDVFLWIRKTTYMGSAIFTRSPGDPLKVYMQISFVLAFLVTLPVMMYHIWQFVRPGLHTKEQKATFVYIPMAVGLFLLGLGFGFFVVFPYLIEFLKQLNEKMGLQQMYGVYEAFSFLINLLFPLALFFELPVIVLFLTKIHIVTPDLLKRGRRYAYLIMVIVSALFAPPDFISNILITIPLILLYEASIFLSAWQLRRTMKEKP